MASFFLRFTGWNRKPAFTGNCWNGRCAASNLPPVAAENAAAIVETTSHGLALERVGEVAVRLGYVTHDRLDAIDPGGKRFGKALVEQGLLSASELWRCFHEQVEHLPVREREIYTLELSVNVEGRGTVGIKSAAATQRLATFSVGRCRLCRRLHDVTARAVQAANRLRRP